MSAAVSLRLPARPENVAVVRQALTGLGDAYDLDPELLGDIKTAVTEACNNVVLHAYPDERRPGGDRGRLRRRAHRRGRARLRRRHPAAVVHARSAHSASGLPLIATLSSRFEIRGGGPDLGLEVDMTFSRRAMPASGGERAGLVARAGRPSLRRPARRRAPDPAGAAGGVRREPRDRDPGRARRLPARPAGGRRAGQRRDLRPRVRLHLRQRRRPGDRGRRRDARLPRRPAARGRRRGPAAARWRCPAWASRWSGWWTR